MTQNTSENNGGERRTEDRHKGHHHWHRPGRLEGIVRPEGFMEPCLLLLLTENATYGYDLIPQLKEFGFGDNQDPGMVYRYLRRLEKRGMIESKWDTTGSGPARRMYSVTPYGDELLSAWTVIVQQNMTVLGQFLNRYQDIEGKSVRGTGRQDIDKSNCKDEDN